MATDILYPRGIKFKSSTVSIALEWVNHFLGELKRDEMVKSFFKNERSKSSHIPKSTPYKEEYERTYNNHLYQVQDDGDKRMFSYLCRVMIYRYALHKGYVKNDSFNFNKYLENSNTELYQLGVLKLGRENQPIEMHNPQIKQSEETEMSQIQSLVNVPKTEATLIHGRLLSELTESDLIQMIRKARKSQEDIADLTGTSTRMKARFEQLEADIKVYAEALDALPIEPEQKK